MQRSHSATQLPTHRTAADTNTQVTTGSGLPRITSESGLQYLVEKDDSVEALLAEFRPPLKLRSSSSSLLLDVSDQERVEALTEVISRTLHEDWILKSITPVKSGSGQLSSLVLCINNKNGDALFERNYPLLEYGTSTKLCRIIGLHLAMHALNHSNKDADFSKYVNATFKATGTNISLFSTMSPAVLNSYNYETGFLDVNKLKQFLKLPTNNTEDLFQSPLFFTREQFNRALDADNVVYADDLPPTKPGDAYFITGSDSKLGGWKFGHRMVCVIDSTTETVRWRFTAPEGMQSGDINFLEGLFGLGKYVEENKLRWAHIKDRKLPSSAFDDSAYRIAK